MDRVSFEVRPGEMGCEVWGEWRGGGGAGWGGVMKYEYGHGYGVLVGWLAWLDVVREV